MSATRLGVLTACALGLVLMIGVIQAGAQGSAQMLKFHSGNQTQTAVGFNINSNAIPPVGSQYIITLALYNAAPQFGKPTGARIGRGLLDCTILSVSTANGDGDCAGIAHVPNGYFLFGGSGSAFNNSKHGYWAITGGVGPYANDRGQLKTGGGTAGSHPDLVAASGLEARRAWGPAPWPPRPTPPAVPVALSSDRAKGAFRRCRKCVPRSPPLAHSASRCPWSRRCLSSSHPGRRRELLGVICRSPTPNRFIPPFFVAKRYKADGFVHSDGAGVRYGNRRECGPGPGSPWGWSGATAEVRASAGRGLFALDVLAGSGRAAAGVTGAGRITPLAPICPTIHQTWVVGQRCFPQRDGNQSQSTTGDQEIDGAI